MAKTDKGVRSLYSVVGLPFHVTGMCDALSSRARGGIQDRKRHDGEVPEEGHFSPLLSFWAPGS